MKITLTRCVGLLAPLVVAGLSLAASLSETDATPSAASRLTETARAFLDGLPAEHRALACFAWKDEERTNWHYIPRDRRGLPLAEMSAEVRLRAHQLLRATLSSAGYLKATTIWRLEQVLFELESRPGRPANHRDPERYWFSIFGEPGADPWGFRLEGHHLSFNFSVVGDRISSTPMFLGTNPAEVRSGPLAGLEVLATESALGRALYLGLPASARTAALISEEAPSDVLLLPGRDGGFESAEGASADAMDEASRERLRRLVHEYLGNLRPDLVAEQRQRIAGDFEQLHFAWAGSTEPGHGHYYRITGPGFAFEYDNTQNGANHAHAVWREFEGDFGRDLLAEHRREHHPR